MRTDDRAWRMRLAGAAGAVLALAAGAHAETSPWYAGGSVSLSRDSNIFRRGDDVAGDTVRSLGIQGGLDQPIGRQRVFANAQLAVNRYERFQQLDGTSYALATGLDWATLNHLNGTLRYSASRGLADYGVAYAPETTEKNVLSSRQAGVTVHYEPHSALSLDASFNRQSVDYSAEAYEPFGSTQNVLGTGLRYRVGPHLNVSLGWRRTRGRTPQFEVAPDVFELDRVQRNDLDLIATWNSDRVAISARLSRSRESHSQESAPGFSGLTGAVDLTWQPTARLRLAGSVIRDTGAATTFLRFGNGGFDVDTRQVSHRYRSSMTFTPSAKVSTGVFANYDRGNVTNPFGDSRDRRRTLGVQGAWEPRTWARVACSVERELRDSSLEGRDSAATVTGCSASMTVR